MRLRPRTPILTYFTDGGGVVYGVDEGHVRGWAWLLVVEAGDIASDVVPEVAQGGHPVDP